MKLASKPFDLDKAHVMTMISNSVRYDSRYHGFFAFQEHILKTTPNLWVCELQTGDRPFVVTDPSNPRHLQVRSYEEIWHKENCLQILANRVSTMYPDAKYIGWFDADIRFVREHDWLAEAIHQLQIYHVIQMFETAVDLGPNYQAINTHKSFFANYLEKGCPHPGDLDDDEEWYMQHGHPGYAFMADRFFWDNCGLYTRSILGSADRNMCYSWIQRVNQSYNENISDGYKYDLDLYQEAAKSLNFDVGCMHGAILHGIPYGGPKQLRGYKSRWNILVENKYDPHKDLIVDMQGLYKLTNKKPRMRDDIRRYMRERDEDSLSLATSDGIKKKNLKF